MKDRYSLEWRAKAEKMEHMRKWNSLAEAVRLVNGAGIPLGLRSGRRTHRQEWARCNHLRLRGVLLDAPSGDRALGAVFGIRISPAGGNLGDYILDKVMIVMEALSTQTICWQSPCRQI